MLLGVDTGGTTTKAVVYSPDGRVAGSAVRHGQRLTPRPRLVERDMDQAWRDCAETIGAALRDAGVDGRVITAIGVVGHGDGLYAVDNALRPVRPGILALDSRTADLFGRWRRDGVVDQVRDLTGQQLFEPSQAALCAWLAAFEPAVFERARWVLTAKDWLRLRLTGEVGTDFSEAMASFGAADGTGYDGRVADLLGIPDVMSKLPPIYAPTDVAGKVTDSAAAESGLVAGTPVVIGTHDVVGGALGAGVVSSELRCVVAGTWGVNEALSTRRVIDARWQSRPWIQRGSWLHMGASPASTSNLGWLLDTVFDATVGLDQVNTEVAAALKRPSSLVFQPFLFGSPYGAGPSGGLLGLRGWHGRADIARAVFEGIAFNHLQQLNALASTFGPAPIRLTGGGARSPVLGQLLADGAGVEVTVADVDETGCWGAAIAAAVGTGRYADVSEATSASVRIRSRYSPTTEGQKRTTAAFARYEAVLEHLSEVWPLLTDDADGNETP